jgi:hypothetical protein
MSRRLRAALADAPVCLPYPIGEAKEQNKAA